MTENEFRTPRQRFEELRAANFAKSNDTDRVGLFVMVEVMDKIAKHLENLDRHFAEMTDLLASIDSGIESLREKAYEH